MTSCCNPRLAASERSHFHNPTRDDTCTTDRCQYLNAGRLLSADEAAIPCARFCLVHRCLPSNTPAAERVDANCRECKGNRECVCREFVTDLTLTLRCNSAGARRSRPDKAKRVALALNSEPSSTAVTAREARCGNRGSSNRAQVDVCRRNFGSWQLMRLIGVHNVPQLQLYSFSTSPHSSREKSCHAACILVWPVAVHLDRMMASKASTAKRRIAASELPMTLLCTSEARSAR